MKDCAVHLLIWVKDYNTEYWKDGQFYDHIKSFSHIPGIYTPADISIRSHTCFVSFSSEHVWLLFQLMGGLPDWISYRVVFSKKCAALIWEDKND